MQGRILSLVPLAVAVVLRDQVEVDLGTVGQQVLPSRFLAEEVLRA